MCAYRVGSVPYVNARPLVAQFELPDSEVALIEAVPSALPALLEDGQVQAILVSSIDLLKPNRVAIGSVGIVSQNKVESVRVVSQVPFNEIRTLALDSASMTSNALAQILLREAGNSFSIAERPQADAYVVIGDAGFEARNAAGFQYDLGELWRRHTGLPFVWALWMGQSADGRLGQILDEAYAWSQSTTNREAVIENAASRSGWGVAEAKRYLTDCVSHRIEQQEKLGLTLFLDSCRQL